MCQSASNKRLRTLFINGLYKEAARSSMLFTEDRALLYHPRLYTLPTYTYNIEATIHTQAITRQKKWKRGRIYSRYP